MPLYVDSEIKLVYCPSEDMTPDKLTKGLGQETFCKLRNRAVRRSKIVVNYWVIVTIVLLCVRMWLLPYLFLSVHPVLVPLFRHNIYKSTVWRPVANWNVNKSTLFLSSPTVLCHCCHTWVYEIAAWLKLCQHYNVSWVKQVMWSWCHKITFPTTWLKNDDSIRRFHY